MLSSNRSAQCAAVAVLDAGEIGEFLPTVLSLLRAQPGVEVFLAGAGAAPDTATDPSRWSFVGGSVASVINQLWRDRRCHVLVVSDAADFPEAVMERALQAVEEDIRIATVSFFSNEGLLSLPDDGPAGTAEDLDTDRVTRTLRTTSPALQPAPVPFAAGPAVLVSAYALSAVGPLADVGGPLEPVLVDFSIRARRKGFSDLVDSTTYCASHSQARVRPSIESSEADDLVLESAAEDSPLSNVRTAARARILGLRVLLDGACLGPLEMGTQVQAVALIEALARRSDVANVAVAIFNELPDYARQLPAIPKVDVRRVSSDNLSVFGRVDIGHQPFQPDGPLDVDSLAAVASRSVVTILDLIAYHGRSYQLSGQDWTTYRRRVQRATAMADGVVVPAAYVRSQVVLERLPVDGDRLFEVTLGTDHLRGDEAMAGPAEPLASDLSAKGFILVLGADYTHKNRDLAITAVAELRRRGFDLPLVMVGTRVFGSSQALEAAVSSDGRAIHRFTSVSSAERNWFLGHASLVLYPTSAEGFGLVPFEAARFGTPTVLVSMGPLTTLAESLPVVAPDWNIASLVDAAESLLSDSSLADKQVKAVLAVGDALTWDSTAAGLATVYRTLLARPRSAPGFREAVADAATARGSLDALAAEHEALQEAYEGMQNSTLFRFASRVRMALWAVRSKTDAP